MQADVFNYWKRASARGGGRARGELNGFIQAVFWGYSGLFLRTMQGIEEQKGEEEEQGSR